MVRRSPPCDDREALPKVSSSDECDAAHELTVVAQILHEAVDGLECSLVEHRALIQNDDGGASQKFSVFGVPGNATDRGLAGLQVERYLESGVRGPSTWQKCGGNAGAGTGKRYRALGSDLGEDQVQDVGLAGSSLTARKILE